MPFNVDEFSSFLNATGVLKDNLFSVVIPLPSGLQGRGANLVNSANSVNFSCDTINFPSTGSTGFQVQRYAYGAIETRPLIPVFQPLICTFICDKDANIQKFFHEWAKLIVNYDFYNGITGFTTTDGTKQMSPYELSYKSEYATDLELVIFKPTGEQVRRVMFREAWPTTVMDVPLNWGNLNRFVRIPVSFAFTDWFDLDIHNL